MARRTGRSDMPIDAAGTVRALGVCRSAMIDVLRTVKPMGPAYHAASMVVSAIYGDVPYRRALLLLSRRLDAR